MAIIAFTELCLSFNNYILVQELFYGTLMITLNLAGILLYYKMGWYSVRYLTITDLKSIYNFFNHQNSVLNIHTWFYVQWIVHYDVISQIASNNMLRTILWSNWVTRVCDSGLPLRNLFAEWETLTYHKFHSLFLTVTVYEIILKCFFLGFDHRLYSSMLLLMTNLFFLYTVLRLSN